MTDDLITPDTTDTNTPRVENEYDEERERNRSDQSDNSVDRPFTPDNATTMDYRDYYDRA